ncbi:lantibiotic dehydratase [Nocardiopsis sp. MG754419]|uniref:lantibiotic dehydratase n=1 Tax=Nocardiopsis sp. MG754419 TaxID=2259865 RepID=UPI001BA5CB40|nr:lantibiotic dehydratase [Nocardiopsis sp. MG754419]MBR8743383.1 lantibiotic dehydratase [Nocardiopsis sp. MG754419]
MSTPSFTVVEGPYLVSRVNLYPHRWLRTDPASARTEQEMIGSLVAEERGRERERAALLAALHRATPGLGAGTPHEDAHRREALAAKRAVFNRRPPRPGLAAHPITDSVAGLRSWVASWQRTAELTARLDAAHEPSLRDERAVLAEWAADPRVDRSTALSSADLHRAVAARAAATGPPDKRMRKAETSLVRYFSRSTMKVSPYSLYTAVHFDDLARPTGPGDEDTPLRATPYADLRRLLVRQTGRALAADPEARSGLEWVLTGGARRLGGDGAPDSAPGEADARLVVRRRRWTPPSSGLRAEAFGEEEVRLPLTGGWERLVSVLEKRAATPVRWEALRDAVTADLGYGTEQASGLLDKLIGVGVLVPWAPVAEQSPDHTRHWHDLVRTLPGATAARATEAFAATEEVLSGFAEADGARRAREVLRLQGLWSAAVGVEGSATSPVVEDCLVSRGVPVERPATARWSADLERLMPLLFAMDDQRVLSGALEQVFVARYGRGGRCSDLDAFAQDARAAFPLTQRLMGGDPEALADADPGLRQVLRARARAVEHLVGLGHADTEQVEVDPSVVDEVAALLPDREFVAHRSFAVFGQVRSGRGEEPEHLVVNHVYGGRARYFSRFLGRLPEEVRRRVVAHVRRVAPPGSDTVHMRSALGFNANLSPALAPEEVALRDEPTLVPGPATHDLALVHTPNGLRLVRADGTAIDPVYTGFLVPHALPYDEMLVAMVADSPFFSFSDLGIDLHERWTVHGHQGATPRIGFGALTLFRRRWGLDTSTFTARGGESPAELHRRVNLERLRRGMPDEVFVRPLQGARLGPLERAMAPKPQHVDFLSRLHTTTAAKRLTHLGPTLVAEELSPHPHEAGVASPDGRHAAEVFLELSTVPGPPRTPHPPLIPQTK